VILWLLLLLLQLPSAVPPRDAGPGANVRGRVLDGITGAPIAGAIVEILVAGGEAKNRVEASASGEFLLHSVPRGAWLAVTPPPLQATHVPQAIQPDLSGDKSEVVVRLDPALAVDGRVVNEYDEPMANVRVMAEPLDVVGTPRASREHFSDDRGTFRLFGLAAGHYRVCAVPARRGGASTYGKTCYPDEAASVRAIEIRHGASSPNVTIPLRRSTPSPVQQPEADAENRVAIRGRVSDEQSRAGMPRALVSLEPESGGERSEVIADERGQFEIRVPPGPYDLRATAGEFKSTHTAHRRELLIMPGDTFGESEINLPHAGTLRGGVVNSVNVPLADVVLELIPQATDKPIPFEHLPTTDDRGQFRVHGIPQGRYTVCARPRSARDGAAPDWMYARGCFAFPIDSRGSDGQVSPIRLERQGGYSITGRIIGPGGNLPPRITAALARIGESQFRMTGLPVAEDGSFVAARLVPGIYEVVAYTNLKAQPLSGVAPQWAGARVEILDSDVTDIVLQLSEGASVRGRVTIDDPGNDRPLRGIEVRAVRVGAAAQVPSPTPVETDDDGAFVLRGVFGTSVVRLRTPHGYAVRSIRYTGRDITDVPTEFGADSTSSVEILLSQSTAELTGRVLDDLGRPAEDAGVLYFPADPARWKAYEGGLRQQSIGGRYRIDKIPGGDYLVIAVRGPRPGWTEKDYVALAPLAERVTLQDGERRVLDLRVVTLGR
jgi:Carboxypeptidase regulatory-like domain